MSMTRVLTGAALIPVLLVIVWYLPPQYFLFLVLAGAATGQHELYAMARARGHRPIEVTGIVAGALLIIAVFTQLFSQQWMLRFGSIFPVTACVLVVLAVRLFSRRPVDGALEDVGATLLGILYVALLFGFQVGIHRWFQGKQFLLFLYLVIWASDTGAYYVGTAFGKRRLYEKISPKKSIEGFMGGTAAAMIVALLCAFWLVKSLSAVEAVVLGMVLALAGTLGDLAESLLKRSAGVKDSGTLIPGHGGVLDRMDSMLFAAPVLYYYLRMR
jgi:phosphatidate cytidylyltransferase